MSTMIRAWTSEQSEAIRMLFTEYATETGIDFSFQNFDLELRALPGDYSEALGGCLLVALDDSNTAIGCVALHRLTDTCCEMKRLYVKPSWKGQGLGRKLAQAIIERASRMHYHRMRLDTLWRLKAAVSLYTSLGFYPIAPYYHNPIEDALFLELDLSAVPWRTISTGEGP